MGGWATFYEVSDGARDRFAPLHEHSKEWWDVMGDLEVEKVPQLDAGSSTAWLYEPLRDFLGKATEHGSAVILLACR